MGFLEDPGMLAFLLIAGHALCDTALQTHFIAQGKNRNTDIGEDTWWFVLPSHGLIHGGAVALVTGIWWLGLAEAIAHTLIDFLKCDHRINTAVEQAAHILCKVIWFAIALQTI